MSSVSVAPQTPVRRIFAFSVTCAAIARSAERVHVGVADALEVADDRHARVLLHARDQAVAAARHDHVDELLHVREQIADGLAIRGRHHLDRVLGQAGLPQALRRQR